jgi:hypothetical protein
MYFCHGVTTQLQFNKYIVSFARKEAGQDVNAGKTKYIVMCRDKNAGRIHTIKNDNNSFENGGIVKIFGNRLNESKFYSGRN